MSPISFNAVDFDALNHIGNVALQMAAEKGFNVHEEGTEIDRKLLLIVGELVEAHEELRSGHDPQRVYFHTDSDKPEDFGVELADALIRLLQLARSLDINIGAQVEQKMRYNATREHLHGRKF